MKKLILITIHVMAFTDVAIGQYRPYHKEDLKKYKKTRAKSFVYYASPYSYGLRVNYRPQKFQGLQVIAMNRLGGTHDDVYFLDKSGELCIIPSDQLRQ